MGNKELLIAEKTDKGMKNKELPAIGMVDERVKMEGLTNPRREGEESKRKELLTEGTKGEYHLRSLAIPPKILLDLRASRGTELLSRK